MKPTNELIWALRRAANRIRDPKGGYNWYNSDSCNCGLLARELLGLSEEELNRVRYNWDVPDTGWRRGANWSGQRCEQTGLPFDEILKQLHALGLEGSDLYTIEFCQPAGPMQHVNFKDPTFVSAFFEQLADDLERQLTGRVESRDGDQPIELRRRPVVMVKEGVA